MKMKFLKPIILLAAVAVAGGAVMFLWNTIIPAVVGWRALSYMQAAGLFVLCRLLFGGSPWRRHGAQFSKAEQLRGMSKEQRRDYIRKCMSNHEANEQ